MNPLKLIVFDVGHGDCIVIHFPTGELGLVDSRIPIGKRMECPAIEYIKKHGGKLSFLCLTHPHADHYSGMLSVLMDPEIHVEEFWHSMSTNLEKVLRLIGERSVPYYNEFALKRMWVESPQGEFLDIFNFLYEKPVNFDKSFNEFEPLIPIGDVNMWVLSPSKMAFKRYERTLVKALKKDKWVNIARTFANRISLVLFLSYGQYRIILGGDALRANWSEMIKGAIRRKIENEFFPLDCLKASHHGAKDSFYDEMWPILLKKNAIIIVSSGSQIHPSRRFLNSIVGKWDVYCTNKGECYDIEQKETKYSEETNFALGKNSKTETDVKCYGQIEVNFYKDSRFEIITQYQPPKKSLCSYQNR